MWLYFLTALGLMMVIEGLLPFIAPATWRSFFRQLLELQDGQLRFFGLASVVIGLLLIMAVGALGG